MNINEITAGMTPQEKEIYFAHQEKRHREEAEKLEYEKAQRRAYRESLIEECLAKYPHLGEERVRKMSIRALEATV